MKKFFINFILAASIFLVNISPAQAVISETADLAISAAAGILQTDDKKLEQEIIAGLKDYAEQEKLRNYIEKTRPIIQEQTEFFKEKLSTALYFIDRIPIVGGVMSSATLSGYILKYEHDLNSEADSEILKKFAELREHNIDAGQGMFEVKFDEMTKTYDKDTSSGVVLTDFALLAAKSEQQANRYKSSAAAIAEILEYAGISMQPEDVGDICIRTSKGSMLTPAGSNLKPAPPVQTATEKVDAAEQTFRNYHNAISNRDLKAAYKILSYNQKERMGWQNFDTYAAGFTNTLSSTVTQLNLISDNGNSKTYAYELTARDKISGGVKVMTVAGEVTLIEDGGRWYIDFTKSKKTGEHIE